MKKQKVMAEVAGWRIRNQAYLFEDEKNVTGKKRRKWMDVQSSFGGFAIVEAINVTLKNG